jgi:hypothetical protein
MVDCPSPSARPPDREGSPARGPSRRIRSVIAGQTRRWRLLSIARCSGCRPQRRDAGPDPSRPSLSLACTGGVMFSSPPDCAISSARVLPRGPWPRSDFSACAVSGGTSSRHDVRPLSGGVRCKGSLAAEPAVTHDGHSAKIVRRDGRLLPPVRSTEHMLRRARNSRLTARRGQGGSSGLLTG